MRFYYPDVEELPLPAGHRFPVAKYRLLRSAVERDDVLPAEALTASPPASPDDLLRAHSAAYVGAMLDGSVSKDIVRRIGLPWSETLMRRSLATVGGAMVAARSALEHGVSGQLAGGTHHAHRDFGSGFCVFNDLAVTALTLLEQNVVDRVAILDLDVHQGDGNAAILKDRPDVFVLSVHGEKNFPFRKVPSDLDVELPDGTEDDNYIGALLDALPAVTDFKPDLLLYLSGADPLKQDRLGRLSLSFEGLAERDRIVFDLCRSRGIPVSIAIGGGYADPIADSVTGYANTFRMTRDVFRF